MEQVTKEQYSNWLENAVTKQFFEQVNTRLNDKAEHLISGGTLGENSAERTSNFVGYITALTEINELNSKEFLKDEYNH